MKKRNIYISFLCMVLCFTMMTTTVFAENIMVISTQTTVMKTMTNKTGTAVYFAPSDLPNVLVYGNKQNPAEATKVYITYYGTGKTGFDPFPDKHSNSGDAIYTQFSTYTAATEFLFEQKPNGIAEFNTGNIMGTYYTYIYTDDKNRAKDNPDYQKQLPTEYCNIYPGGGTGGETGGGSTGGETGGGSTGGETGKDEELTDVNEFTQAYRDYIDKALADNLLYKSLADVIADIDSIFNEDYSQGQAGLDKLGVFNITMRYPQNYKEFGNDVIGEWSQPFTTSTKIDYGLNNQRTMDLRWYFGGTDNNGNPIRGVKYYTDIVIGGFLWLCFIWYLWHNLPNLISGEIGTAINLAGTATGKEETFETRTVTWDNDTGEVLNDTTTRKTKKRGK